MANLKEGEPGSLRVAYVEDNHLHRVLLARDLDRTPGVEGIEIEIARTCAEVVASIEKVAPDVLLLDHALPCGNGHQILAAMNDVAVRALTIFLLTGAEWDDPRLNPYRQYQNLRHIPKTDAMALRAALMELMLDEESDTVDIVALSYDELRSGVNELRTLVQDDRFQKKAEVLIAQFSYYLTSSADENPLSRQLAHLARGLMVYLHVADQDAHFESIFNLIDHILSFDENELQQERPVSDILVELRDLYQSLAEIKEDEVPGVTLVNTSDFEITVPQDLQIILHNLVLNAKAAGANNVYFVCDEGDDGCVRLSVVDDGPGLPYAFILPKLENSTKGREHGNGLRHVISISDRNGWNFNVSEDRSEFVLKIPKVSQSQAKVA